MNIESNDSHSRLFLLEKGNQFIKKRLQEKPEAFKESNMYNLYIPFKGQCSNLQSFSLHSDELRDIFFFKKKKRGKENDEHKVFVFPRG